MVFVRNQNGSHNPHEAMEMDDFLLGVGSFSRRLRSGNEQNSCISKEKRIIDVATA